MKKIKKQFMSFVNGDKLIFYTVLTVCTIEFLYFLTLFLPFVDSSGLLSWANPVSFAGGGLYAFIIIALIILYFYFNMILNVKISRLFLFITAIISSVFSMYISLIVISYLNEATLFWYYLNLFFVFILWISYIKIDWIQFIVKIVFKLKDVSPESNKTKEVEEVKE